MAKIKTWNDKLQEAKNPVVKFIEFPFAGIPAQSKMLIATPKLIEDYIIKIPAGRNLSIKTLREDLASEYRADYTCPVTTGIFLRIVAEAAYEKYLSGKNIEIITPFWRMIEPESPLAQKLACGKDFISDQRRLEKIATDS